MFCINSKKVKLIFSAFFFFLFIFKGNLVANFLVQTFFSSRKEGSIIVALTKKIILIHLVTRF